MDEVLVDFVGGALRAHGWTRERLYSAMEPGVWNMAEPMGLTHQEFWKPIDRLGVHFWCNLPALPWAAELLEIVKQLTDDWHIVSSPFPSGTRYSYEGKVRWLKQRFGPRFDRFAITRHKYIFAGPNVILIDDNEETVKRFCEADGLGLLFPRRLNKLHLYGGDPVNYMRPYLKELCHGVQIQGS